MRHSVFCFRPLLLAVAGLLWQSASATINGQISDEYTVGVYPGAISIFAAKETTNVTRKFTVTNNDKVPLQIALYHNYTLEGSHVFNFRHNIYPKQVNNDPTSHQNTKSTSQNWEWTWANRTGMGGQNIPHWWIVQNVPALQRRRLGTVDFASLFEETVQGASLTDPRPKALSLVTIRVSEEAATGLPKGCRKEDLLDKAISCEKPDAVALQLGGCRPVLTDLSPNEYYLIRVPEDCSSIQLRIWLEALSEDLPIVGVFPNSYSEPNPEGLSEEVQSDVELGRSAVSPQHVGLRDGPDDPFAITDSWKDTKCYKQAQSSNLNMADWSVSFDSRSVYFEKQAQKSFSYQPVAFVISPYANLAAMDPNYLSMAYIVEEGTSQSEDNDHDNVKGNRYGMYVDSTGNLIGAGLWDKPGDSRTLGFYSAAFGRTESGFTLGAAPLTKFYACAAGAPGETTVSEAGVKLCLQWLLDNHRRLNVTMVVHDYELKINRAFILLYSTLSNIFPQLTIGQNAAGYDDPPKGKREVTLTTVAMPPSFGIDTHNWGLMLPCSERAGNGTVQGGWAGAYSSGGQSCMYAAFSTGCVQTGPTAIEIGDKKTTALAWLVGQFSLLQHYNRLANAYDYRLLSYQIGQNTGNSPAIYHAPGVSQILQRFDPANDHLQGLEKTFTLKPGESKDMVLTFTRANVAAGAPDQTGEAFTNRVGNIEVYASDVQDGAGPQYYRVLRVPYRLDWGEEDEFSPRWYLGED